MVTNISSIKIGCYIFKEELIFVLSNIKSVFIELYISIQFVNIKKKETITDGKQ